MSQPKLKRKPKTEAEQLIALVYDLQEAGRRQRDAREAVRNARKALEDRMALVRRIHEIVGPQPVMLSFEGKVYAIVEDYGFASGLNDDLGGRAYCIVPFTILK